MKDIYYRFKKKKKLMAIGITNWKKDNTSSGSNSEKP